MIWVTWTDGLDLAVIEDGSNGLVQDMQIEVTAIAGTTDSGVGWIETARELAENVEPRTGKIPSRWGRYMIWIYYLYTLQKKEVCAQQKCPSKHFKICYVYVKRKAE